VQRQQRRIDARGGASGQQQARLQRFRGRESGLAGWLSLT
jgi:hypothetical protein